MKVWVVADNNGKGLSKDIDVIRETLSGHDVGVLGYFEPAPTERRDIVLFLERVPPHHLGAGRVAAYLPNPEWHADSLEGVQRVLAKTADCEHIFRGADRCGWTSPDVFDTSVRKEKRMIHVAGGSPMKGTDAVVEALWSLPQLELDLVAHENKWDLPPNVRFHSKLPSETLRQMCNRAVVHLCPSSYEGFGHYLNEARSAGAVIISTNAAPMNELVGDDGLLAAYNRTSGMSAATLKHVCPRSLETMIRTAMSWPLEELVARGQAARASYLRDRQEFGKRFRTLLASMSSP